MAFLLLLLSMAAHAQTGNYSTSCVEDIRGGKTTLTCYVGLGEEIDYNNWPANTQWDFGDGTKAVGNPKHTWVTMGHFIVTETIPGQPQNSLSWIYVVANFRGWCVFDGYLQWWTPKQIQLGYQEYIQPNLASCKNLIQTALNAEGVCHQRGLPRRLNLVRIVGTFMFLKNSGTFTGTCDKPGQITFH